jgi:hypothetical protein
LAAVAFLFPITATQTQAVALFGVAYDSVSGGEEADFLTGAMEFRVKEIEVFEIAD